MPRVSPVHLPTLAEYRAAHPQPVMPPREDPEDRPLLTVITVVRNGAATLARTIESIRQQTYSNIEYLVIDGGSTDGTLDLLRQNEDLITYWHSEPDKGISDGFNKGIAWARGRYITLLNADDWFSPDQMQVAVETLRETDADFVFGDLVFYSADGTPRHRITGDAGYVRRIPHVMPALNHPSVVVHRRAYEAVGLFCLDFRLAMDYEWLLRLHRQGGRGVYQPKILGHMSLDGVSDAQAARATREVRNASILHGYSPTLAMGRYLFRRFRGGIRRALPADLSCKIRRLVNRSYSPVNH